MRSLAARCGPIAAAAVVLIAAAGCGGSGRPSNVPEGAGEEAARAPGSEGAAGEPEEEEPLRVPDLARLVVHVYFPSAAGDGLSAEPREIFETVHAADRAKQILSEILSGPQSDSAVAAVPEGTSLRQVYVLDDGTAYADFSARLREGLGGGSAREILAVYAIVDSLVLNVPEIRRVGILVEGEPCETLNGHLDLRRPLPADPSLIVSAAAGARRDGA